MAQFQVKIEPHTGELEGDKENFREKYKRYRRIQRKRD